MSDFFNGLPAQDESLWRGIVLRQQHRYADAIPFFDRAIEAAPDNATAHFQLALCHLELGRKEKTALKHIDRAIQLVPNQATYLAIKGFLLGSLGRVRESRQFADEALRLDAANIDAHNLKTRCFCAQARWSEMERSARDTLEIDSTDEIATNFLAHALRRQGKLAESQAVTKALLASIPEDAWAQTNAGWAALETGNYRQANQQFLHALRLNPQSGEAREGLLHSINSHVPFYRFYYRINALYERLNITARLGLGLALIISFNFFVRPWLHHHFGHIGLEVGWLLLLLYCFGFAVGREFGNLFLLLHPMARHALTRDDKNWAIGVGLGYLYLLYLSFKAPFYSGVIFLPALATFFLVSVLTSLRDSSG